MIILLSVTHQIDKWSIIAMLPPERINPKTGHVKLIRLGEYGIGIISDIKSQYMNVTTLEILVFNTQTNQFGVLSHRIPFPLFDPVCQLISCDDGTIVAITLPSEPIIFNCLFVICNT
jgi:hypothetical protein